jgi:hypothetical protein
MQTDRFRRFHFSFEEVQPALEELLSFLKSEDSDDSHPVQEAIRAILPLLTDNPGITGGYILRKAGEIHLDTGVQIANYMKDAEYLALFVCTAGTIFTELTERYNQKNDYLEAFVADAIGSLTVEKAMDQIQMQLEQSMQAENLQISNRYSPGYCGWPVADQRELFEQIGVPVPVSLTESCLMLPIKSVSGIMGVGARVRKRPYACQICKNKNCTYRKIIQS